VANQPLYWSLDVNSSKKAARFTRFAIVSTSLLVLVDVPGFLPGTIKSGMGLSFMVLNCCMLKRTTVPKLPLSHETYGGAYDVMNSKHIGADMNYAWPTAEIAVMGAKEPQKLSLKQINKAEDPAAKLLEKQNMQAVC
jgi:propionyl-CoA carboxylase beta chain